MLEHPWVVAQRERYAGREQVTATEARLTELIAEGKMDDVSVYSLNSVCAGGGP